VKVCDDDNNNNTYLKNYKMRAEIDRLAIAMCTHNNNNNNNKWYAAMYNNAMQFKKRKKKTMIDQILWRF